MFKPLHPSFVKKIQSIALIILLILSGAVIPSFAVVKSYKKAADGVTFSLDKGLLKVLVRRVDIIEVKYTIFNAFETKPSLVVNNSWKNPTPYQVAENKTEVTITTAKLKIRVNKATNAIIYTDLKGNIITAEDSENKTITPATVAGISTNTISTQFVSPQNEGLFGLGCHPLDSLSINYKGRNQDLLIKYLTGAIPVLLSTKGYGLMWDNYSASNFYGAEADNTKFKYVSESGKQVDYYFFYGPGFDHIIDAYRTATGKAPMFGKWAFGLFQSQDRYMSEDEIISVKDNYRNNHIPVDVLVQDWYYWDPLPIGSHVMKPERYPHPQQLINELHKANLHAMISIWPVFGKGTPNYDALQKMGGLTDITWDNVVTHTFDTYYDAHSPKARELYWDQARDSLIKRYGWDAWWIDQCEPDNGALLDARRQSNFAIGKGIDYFNTYSLQHTKGVYEGWRRDIPGKRAFFLVRQSFAGEQRNAATLWSSDIECTFKDFKHQVPQGINTGVSGIPYWTSDIGGYHFHWKTADWSQPDKRELFTRWFQFGTFCPIFRIHGKGERALFSKNWDDKTKAILLNFDKLRYRLLPYIYSLAGRVTTDNYTIMRSLAFDFRDDSKVYGIPDQYMFGPAFMVNPVTEQLYTSADADKKAKARQVYLPAASKWYDFWTGELLDGGQTISAAAPIEILPLYVKAGSIIPMGPHMEYATEKPANNIELRIYPGADGSFKFYEDENDNYNYEKGQYATFNLNWNDKTRKLTISDTKGKFPGMLKSRTFNIVMVKGSHGANVEVTAKADKVVKYAGKALVVSL
ncbi:alpha-D-xyloside xylohydrolase [Mucilaginibacter lappiensis]|uniref:Alpha-D-xyloside xylohydrolase n=1 Tax=Mucilaginibacter lappiensis TaxID=354630 RepID=A0ABR6PSS1_9SPHI|nr:glycoside hydrolase family 31 protein [Mucilaginibacter lappiensis]MBB6112838.1 alpha-D-xyloside xylohydrolase [Mucilaginibacter lappiensis]SIS08312.1 alpha-D-xyloside xylohydrolase [Mucilaginibacter lappiensis]